MLISHTEIWFQQSSHELQRMKFLVWLRKKCIGAGYKNVKILSRSGIAKPVNSCDYLFTTQNDSINDYIICLEQFKNYSDDMQKRFIEAGGIKWGESLFIEVI